MTYKNEFNPDWICRGCGNKMETVDQLFLPDLDIQDTQGVQWCQKCGTVQMGDRAFYPLYIESIMEHILKLTPGEADGL